MKVHNYLEVNMIIYFEGADGSGKTTLKEKVVDRLMNMSSLTDKYTIVNNIEPYINSNPSSGVRCSKTELYLRWRELIDDQEAIYVIDRSPLSDIVYRAFDEHDVLMTLDDFTYLIKTTKVINVFCDSDRAEELMKARGDDNPIALAKHRTIRYLYRQAFSMVPWRIEYDVARAIDNENYVDMIIFEIVKATINMTEYVR